MLKKPYTIVDVETTGMSGNFDRIIEIGMIRVEKNKIVDKFETLVNPQTHVSPFIESFTGISARALEEAPVFETIKNRIFELLDSAIVVAHNARFDYSFLKSEMKRVGISYNSKTLCTVKLSRNLFPQYKSHSLESIIDRFGLDPGTRHRAYSDAYALWQFLRYLRKNISAKKLEKIIKILLRSSYAGNPQIEKQIEELPETAGVYIFYDEKNIPLYVGKSKNIKERVISHFTSDYQSPNELSLTKSVKRLDHSKTAGELGALILESRIIKELSPVFNRKLKVKKKLTILVKEMIKGKFLTLKPQVVDSLDGSGFEKVFGVFKSKVSAKEALRNLAKKYTLCPKILGLDEGTGSCFEYKLGRCRGACIGREKNTLHNARFIIAYEENKQFRSWPYAGPIEIVEKNEEDELFESFIIDKWRLKDPGSFDLDIYKIISSFLKHNRPAYRVLPEIH